MAATYSTSLATDKDTVRLLIGDTNTTSAMFQDEEINAVLAIQTNVMLAAALMADSAAGKYSRSVSFSVEGLSIQNSQKAEGYRKLAESLRAQAASGNGIGGVGINTIGGTPFVGGISKDEMHTQESDTDRVDSMFGVGTCEVVPEEIDTSDY